MPRCVGSYNCLSGRGWVRLTLLWKVIYKIAFQRWCDASNFWQKTHCSHMNYKRFVGRFQQFTLSWNGSCSVGLLPADHTVVGGFCCRWKRRRWGDTPVLTLQLGGHWKMSDRGLNPPLVELWTSFYMALLCLPDSASCGGGRNHNERVGGGSEMLGGSSAQRSPEEVTIHLWPRNCNRYVAL